MFNFNNFVDNTYVKAFLDDNITLPCDCTDYPIVKKQYKHIITVNIMVILIEIKRFSKCLNHCENRIADYQKSEKNMMTGWKSYFQSSYNKPGIAISLSEWEPVVLSAIVKKNLLTTKLAAKNLKKTLKLKYEIFSEELKILQKKRFVVSTDKVSDNAFISQSSYDQVLINELGLNNVSNITWTYTKTTKPIEMFVAENILFLK